MFSKKILAFLSVAVLFAFSLSIVAFAAGVDDGVISVTTKNSKKYIGTAKSDFCIEYVSANGDNNAFYRYSNTDVNEDNITDICDLVLLNNAIVENGESIDFNFDSILDYKDLSVVHQFILGTTDFEIE